MRYGQNLGYVSGMNFRFGSRSRSRSGRNAVRPFGGMIPDGNSDRMRIVNYERVFGLSTRPWSEFDGNENRPFGDRSHHLNEIGDCHLQHRSGLRYRKFRFLHSGVRGRPGPHLYRGRLWRNDCRCERTLYGAPPDRRAELDEIGNGGNVYLGLQYRFRMGSGDVVVQGVDSGSLRNGE